MIMTMTNDMHICHWIICHLSIDSLSLQSLTSAVTNFK